MGMRLTTIIMAGSGRVVFSARKCLILACLTGLCAVMALFPEFHDNTKVTEPRISSFETSSVQTCIHKCHLHALCNVVSARMISARVECILSNVCYETLQKRLRKSNGWQTYVILEKLYHLNMVDVGLLQAIASTVAGVADKAGIHQVTAIPSVSGPGKFVLRHQSSGKCLAYKSGDARLVLRMACQFELIETSDKYLQRKGNNRCIKRLNDTHDSELTLSSDCTSAAAAFRYNATEKLIVFTADDGQDLCVYFPQGGGAESTRSFILADCGKEPKSYFQKEPRP